MPLTFISRSFLSFNVWDTIADQAFTAKAMENVNIGQLNDFEVIVD
jgi:hypothetical protein